MTVLLSLIRFRRTHALRVMTMLLLVLAVSPFTAPFSTCDFGTLTGNAPIHADLDSAEKKIQDSAADLVSHTFTFLIVSFATPVRPADLVESFHAPQFVLRI